MYIENYINIYTKFEKLVGINMVMYVYQHVYVNKLKYYRVKGRMFDKYKK